MNINTNYNLAFDATVGMIKKLVQTYIYGGELTSRFDIFDKDAVEYGQGFELSVLLAAAKQNDGSTKADEHGVYRPKGMSLVFDKVFGGQFAVTLDERRVNECVGNAAKAQEYAAELVETLYQGWIDEKNKGVAESLGELVTAGTASVVNVPLGEDVAEFAQAILMNVKAKVEDLREGVTGASYGNTFVGDSRIAARDVVIVMSNTMAATLDVYGYAKVFSPEYVDTTGVRRITSSRIPEDTILITDARNVQVRRHFDKFVEIENSDGSRNFFYNKYEFVAPAIANGGTYDGQIGFPYVVIKKQEA